jgi:FMN phosphatase YigB (HAD superfamily)
MRMSFKQVGTLLFDFGGTLDLPGAHWLDRFLSHYREAEVNVTREELDEAYAYATRCGDQAGAGIYDWGLRRLVDQLVEWQADYLLQHLPARVPSRLRELTGGIAQRFCAQSAAGFQDSRAVLARLAPRFQIGVVSNFYGNLEAVLQEAGLAPFIQAAIDSSRVDAFKPDPKIFLAALNRLNAIPERTAMVGDSLDKDCAPARRLGLKTVWLRGASIGYTQPVGSCADLVVENLHELVEICLGD